MNRLLPDIPLESLIPAVMAAVAWLFLMLMNLRRHLHWLQLEDYSPSRLALFMSKRVWELVLANGFAGLFLAIVAQVMFSRFLPEATMVEAGAFLVWSFGAILSGLRLRRSEANAKKKLVMTARAKRIFVISIFVSLLALRIIGNIFPEGWVGLTLLGSMHLTAVLAGLWLSLAVLVLAPQEKIAQKRFMDDAQRILGEVRPLIIGITGSYGKTGTKELLSAMLAERYNVFRPPGSYNTLMGVTRAIREGLRPYHEVFVVEMGAYKVGSIKKLCDLVKPQHGLITVIGVQHLERFGSQENIARAKGELIQALLPDGVAVLNGDDPFSRKIGAARSGEVIYFGIEKGEGVVATNIRITPDGSNFDLVFPDGGRQAVHLSLLGRAAIANATAAAAMAERLGVAREGIARVLATMPHVRHRLEPRTGDGGIRVIDDAFNSNPTGAAMALEVLSLATGGRRILVTPGMVELGEMEEEANRKFGVLAAGACDLAVLIGQKRIEPIKAGLIEGGFPSENIKPFATLNQALEWLKGYLKPDDTMLLENDLPDQYAGM